MKTSISILSFYLIIFPLFLKAQNFEEKEILNTINMVFDSMREEDSMKLKSLFVPNARLTTYSNVNGMKKEDGSIEDFAKSVGSKHKKIWDEQIYSYKIEIDGEFAFCLANYVFFYGDTIHHCGIDNISLAKLNGKWKILEITDNSNTYDCSKKIRNSKSEKKKIDSLLTQWHIKASKADTSFFSDLSSKGIYIGTDPTEHWTKEIFTQIYLPYFQSGKSWEFIAKERNIYISEDLNHAWFDELLSTWMGPCRASGYMEYINFRWQITHYHLSMSIPNEKTKEVIKTLNNN